MEFTEKRTFSDNNGQMRTIPDKYGHWGWWWYYLCIVISPRITQINTDFLIKNNPEGKYIIRENLWNLWCKKTFNL